MHYLFSYIGNYTQMGKKKKKLKRIKWFKKGRYRDNGHVGSLSDGNINWSYFEY